MCARRITRACAVCLQVPKGFTFQSLRCDGINAHVVCEAAVSDLDKIHTGRPTVAAAATLDSDDDAAEELVQPPKLDRHGHLRGKKARDTNKPLGVELTLDGACCFHFKLIGYFFTPLCMCVYVYVCARARSTCIRITRLSQPQEYSGSFEEVACTYHEVSS